VIIHLHLLAVIFHSESAARRRLALVSLFTLSIQAVSSLRRLCIQEAR
jgi:hypothetical protein